MVKQAVQIAGQVPVHRLGISQILAFGLLFYVFAPLKPYLAQAAGLTEATILSLISVAMIVQALMMPVIGNWCDRIGALRVMGFGFWVGALGLFMIGATGAELVSFLPPWLYLLLCFVMIAFGLGMSSYEVAFSAAVQLDEPQSRRNISIITFYGGVASSLSWLALWPLLSHYGLFGATTTIAAILAVTAMAIQKLSVTMVTDFHKPDRMIAPFRWQLLNRTEKKSLILLAASGGFEYLLFSATTLLWISWFGLQYQSLGLAVFLASLYGPFQVVGRVLEMKLGRYFDARITGAFCYVLVPASLWLVQVPSIPFAVAAMVLFGMGHGVLTVSYGFVTNLYFRAEIYGRAKGWTATTRALGAAIGPSIGGWLFASHQSSFMLIMIYFSVMSGICFVALLWLRPTNQVHHTT